MRVDGGIRAYTKKRAMLEELRGYCVGARELKIVTGYVSLRGLSMIAPYFYHMDKVKLLVGIHTKQSVEMRERINDTRYPGVYLTEHKCYDMDILRDMLRSTRLEIKYIDSVNYKLFHPKGYLLRGGDWVYSIVGSNNLTQSGLNGNIEWSIGTDNIGVYNELVRTFDVEWSKQGKQVNSVLDTPRECEIVEVQKKGSKYIVHIKFNDEEVGEQFREVKMTEEELERETHLGVEEVYEYGLECYIGELMYLPF